MTFSIRDLKFALPFLTPCIIATFPFLAASMNPNLAQFAGKLALIPLAAAAMAVVLTIVHFLLFRRDEKRFANGVESALAGEV